MENRRVLVCLAAVVTLWGGAARAAAQGWSAGAAFGTLESASFDETLHYSPPMQIERQDVEVDSSALLAEVEWQFGPRFGLALEYHHGGDASIAQTIEATAFHPQGDGPRTSHVLTVGPVETELPIDLRFASLGLVVHFFQLGRVEMGQHPGPGVLRHAVRPQGLGDLGRARLASESPRDDGEHPELAAPREM